MFLLSVCDFFICSFSGPFGIGALFDTPMIAVNAAPLAQPYPKHCHVIPKLLYHGDEVVSPIDIGNGMTLGDQKVRLSLLAIRARNLLITATITRTTVRLIFKKA